MTRNKDTLTGDLFEQIPDSPKIKCTIYIDHSKKGITRFCTPKYHNTFQVCVQLQKAVN